jgi:hypothetical protein
MEPLQGRQTWRAQRSVGPPGLRFVLLRSRGCELRSCLWLPSGRAFGASFIGNAFGA